jgi:hypothetical protein
MKKIIYLFFAFILLSLVAVYYFIPGMLIVSTFANINCPADAAFRTLSGTEQLNRSAIFANGSGSLTQDDYTITKKLINNFEIEIKHNNTGFASEMNLVSLPNDSSAIKWHYKTATSLNPFKRIRAYREAVSIKKNMQVVLRRVQTYLSKSENVYGIVLKESSTTDTALIAIKTEEPYYPKTSSVYRLIKKLNQFCNSREACSVTGNPMLNITQLSPSAYRIMVALPVNRFMDVARDSVFSIRMIPGKFLVTEVKGGTATINEALRQIDFYFQDYRRTSMAIPFQYLLTDREKEPDTSKWVTKIYAPVY